ncbi:MAG: hypothetical protein B7Z68_03455 [Acidobacteria bacterium 21-70-11]|nr:MAG: hypothetical protein B7Z68_03455 [Acidobacteria bacterium 21-70-11]
MASLLLGSIAMIGLAGCSRSAPAPQGRAGAAAAPTASAAPTAGDTGQGVESGAPPAARDRATRERPWRTERRRVAETAPLAAAQATAEPPAAPPTPVPPVSVPAGTAIAVRLDAGVSSATATQGELLHGELTAPLTAGGRTVAGIGTPVEARVESVVASGRLARPATLSLVLTAIRMGAGSVPVVTDPLVRSGSTHTKRNERYIGGGALLGALAGQLIGGHTHSTINGAAVGAAVGTGAAAVTGRLDVVIGAGEVLRFTLAQPATLQPSP